MHFTIDRILLLLLVLLLVGAVLWSTVALLMAWMLLHPLRMSAGRAIYHLHRLSPGDLGLAFEEQPFTVIDQRSGKKLFIAGWWIPARTVSEWCVVMLHGYADAKVGAIAWAPLLHELNLNILAIDLRAHGNSDGRFSTGGFFERDDVIQVIDQLLNVYPHQTRQLIIFGASLGAAVATAVAAQRADISALILESPFTDYEKAIAAHVRLMGLPSGLTVHAAIKVAEAVSGARFAQVRPIELLEKIECPTLIIVGTEDDLLDEEDHKLFERTAITHPRFTYWPVENSGHLQAIAADPAGYEQHLQDFLLPTLHRF